MLGELLFKVYAQKEYALYIYLLYLPVLTYCLGATVNLGIEGEKAMMTWAR